MANSASPDNVAARPLRVMAVDDAAANLMVLTSLLRREQVVVCAVECGSDALAAYQSFAPDLVFMDLSMPVMDGYTAAAAIREHERTHGLPRAAIIALTAYAADDELTARVAVSMDACLSKPVRKADVLHILRVWGRRNLVD
jgi:CheY-like chemotaxis protein